MRSPNLSKPGNAMQMQIFFIKQLVALPGAKAIVMSQTQAGFSPDSNWLSQKEDLKMNANAVLTKTSSFSHSSL